ncbi:uncharacterized protein LOC119688758 [Teleopsis dalmanni]|uniref:uncharacterized protein LOC119688758 n=1 Tax=Teleopsis dalmanni TaxID=139649 RepID=UPI0018CC84C0|nr:uncharacterized protein LOC119688758 [Teleopsis dalmanni]
MLGDAMLNKEAEMSNADKETTAKSAAADTNFTTVKNDIDAVKLTNLPSFLQTDPELWFTQVDGLLHINRITSDLSKFYTVITALDGETLRQVSDIAKNPPATGKYETLKNELISRFGESRQKQLIKLLTDLDVSNKRPTQLLREMRDLAASNMFEDALSALWLQRLPSNIRCILSACSSKDVNQMAELTDRITDNMPTPHYVMATASAINRRSNTEESTLEARVTALEISLQQVVSKLSEIAIELRRPANSQGRSRARSSSRTQFKSQREDRKVCYYHIKFGTAATKCLKPCEFGCQTTDIKQKEN